MNTKICSKCGRKFPATAEYFYRNKRGLFGLRADCKECCSEYSREYQLEYYQENKEQIKENARQWRLNNPERKKELDRDYYQNHKEEHYQRGKEWKQNNPERAKELNRESFRRRYSVRKKELNARAKEWRKNNPEKTKAMMRRWRENNPERAKEYYQENKERFAEYSRNRKARVRGAEGFHTFVDIAEKYNAQHGKCFYCNCDLNYEFHVDHFYPISKGGSNYPDNLVIACPACNYSKNDKMPEEFIASLPNRVWN